VLIRLLPDLWSFVNRYRWWFASIALAVLFYDASSSWYYSRYSQDIVFYTGPSGGTGETAASKIAAELESQKNTIGAPEYKVRIVETDGFEENRQRISSDEIGQTIGFAHDGFGKSGNVRILLPLQHSYMHVLCRRGFLQTLIGNNAVLGAVLERDKPVQLTQIAPFLSSSQGRVYLGPPQSGTRQVATLILEKIGQNPSRLSTNGIADWDDMRAALNNGSIDLAFCSTVVGARVIREISKDGSAILLDLEEIRDAIAEENDQIDRDALPKNAYAVKPNLVAGEFDPATIPFCPSPINTTVTRKVLICPGSMDSRMVFDIATAAKVVAERDLDTRIVWSAGAPEEVKAANRDFKYALHPGAEWLKADNRPRVNWLPDNIGPHYSVFMWTILFTIITAMLERIHLWLRRATSVEDGDAPVPDVPSNDPVVTPDAGRATESRTDFEELRKDIQKCRSELGPQPRPLKAREFDHWATRVAGIRAALDKARGRGGITKDEWDALIWSGEFKELESDLATRMPPSRQAVPARNSDTES